MTNEELINKIVERAENEYGDRIKRDILHAALEAAHKEHPIRLSDLLNTCHTDFQLDVIAGAYRHFDPATNKILHGWVAQHSRPR